MCGPSWPSNGLALDAARVPFSVTRFSRRQDDDVWLHGPSDGEMFLVIRDGVTADMQPYANRLSDEDVWHLVNYLKTLAVPDR